MTGQPPTSDFYQLRRLAVKDVSGLLGFVIGFLGAMPCSWRHMTTDWLAGFVNRAVAHFLLIEFAIASACGLLGLAVGVWLGRVWQSVHSSRRTPVP